MREVLCACLLAALQSMTPAQAYEADIHYSTTYVLARALGWTEADALTIASANQGVDENQDTVAALEVDTTSNSFHQAERNLRFHCFSAAPGRADQVSADVLEVMSGHFADVPDGDEDPRSHARRLIALGVALHCQQDAYSHAGFGGSCGPHPGTCYGHTYQTFLDQVAFGLVRKHHFDPDHPGVSGQRLLQALQGTINELAARLPKVSLRSITTRELVALSDDLRGSGLELPDEVRRECNRYIAGKWLHVFFHSGSGTQTSPDELEILAPEVSRTCRNASLASATIARIPDPRYPHLNADASPSLVRADGTYQQVPGFDTEEVADVLPNYNSRRAVVQLSHWTQLLPLPRMAQVARASEDGSRPAR